MALPVIISEIHFIYDLSATDEQFFLKIFDVSCHKQREPLYFESVSTSKKINDQFTRHILSRPCCIDEGTKIWIIIDFKQRKDRLSIDNFYEAPNSVMNRLALVRKNSPASGQIISNIIFN